MLDKLLSNLKSQDYFYREAKKISGYLDEAYRKAGRNRNLYISAHEKIKKTLDSNKEFLTSFCELYQDSSIIWDAEVDAIADKSKHFYSIMKLITALGFYQRLSNVPNSRHKKNADYLFAEGIADLKSVPKDILEFYQINPTDKRILKPQYYEYFITELEKLRNYSAEMKKSKGE